MNNDHSISYINQLGNVVTLRPTKDFLRSLPSNLTAEGLISVIPDRFRSLIDGQVSLSASARALQSQSRAWADTISKRPNLEARPDDCELAWVMARLFEWVGHQQHPRLCRFCYRTAEMRSDGRPMEYCLEHAQAGVVKNTAGYLRGRKSLESFNNRLSELMSSTTDELHPSPDAVSSLSERLLDLSIRFTKSGGGDAAYLFGTMFQENSIPSCFRLTNGAPAIDVTEISDGYPDITEFTTRWRASVGDTTGSTFLRNNDATMSIPGLLEQWIRYTAWYDAGDRTSRVGKGRPHRIDPDEAFKMRAEGLSTTEIASRFGVAPGSVTALFRRERGKQ